MFKIAICDDSQTSSTDLMMCIKELAKEVSLEAQIDVFRNFRSLGKAVASEKYQFLVLDTTVAGADGIEYAKLLRQSGCDSEILFYTEDTGYALEAYSVYPVGYMIKPATKKKMRDLFRHVIQKYLKQPSVVLKTTDGERLSVPVSQIWYIEVFRTELDVHCGNEVKACIGSLTDVFEQLPQSGFYRSHRSYIVNLEYVAKMNKYAFTMQNGDKVTIAKNRYAEAKSEFEKFAGSF